MEQLRIKLKNKESRDKEEEEEEDTSSVVTKLPKTHLAHLTRKGLAAYLSDECVEALVYVMQVIHVMHCIAFLPDPGVSGVRSMGPGVSIYVQDLWLRLDVTLSDDDTNSI